MELNEITGEIVDAAFVVHSSLGPGLLEHIYKECMQAELRERGLSVESEIWLPITYKGLRLDSGYRLDLLVEDVVVIELKAVKQVHPVYHCQLLSYLKLANKPLGLLINFHTPLLKNGITRIANQAPT